MYIIDALGPFIDVKKTPLNWSKIPFADLEEESYFQKRKPHIIKSFQTFIQKIVSIGYTAISLDDLAHLVVLDCYSSQTKETVIRFQSLYTQLFRICQKYHIDVYVNTDIFFYTTDTKNYLKEHPSISYIQLLKEACEKAFIQYPIKGIMTRIGECDGVDVKGLWKSEITIKTPLQAKTCIQKLIPLFEKYDKNWIFRTWTIGGGLIGDLMWNKKTALKTFSQIQSSHFFISLKYGEADFFRSMRLNPLFSLSNLQKICEFQAKREYDFYGELPFYTGFEYETYVKELQQNPTIKGYMVWCQTGGWMTSQRITYLTHSSKYVELNTESTLRILEGKSALECISDFFTQTEMPAFLQLYYELSQKILYPSKQKRAFFRKIFVPPIIWIYWNNLTINSFMASFVKHFYQLCPQIPDSDFKKLQKLAKNCRLENGEFYVATLKILYLARKTLHEQVSIAEFETEIHLYNAKYDFFKVSVGNTKSSKRLQLLFNLSLRKNQKYRIIDRLLFNRVFVQILYSAYIKRMKQKPTFLDSQGMQLMHIFK